MLLKNSIGSKIKNIREVKGLSQTEVVEKLKTESINISRETLSKIENDNRTISAMELNILCKVLGIDIGEIFETDESDDDLVTLFRKKANIDDEVLVQLETIQDMIKIFINQEKIFKGEYKQKQRKPLWEEF